MSGGVDSSVAAWLLRREGHEVQGIFMRHEYQPALSEEECREFLRRIPFVPRVCSLTDNGTVLQTEYSVDQFLIPREAAVAAEIAGSLGIEFTVFDACRQFRSVVDYFVREYFAARTPNPCAFCNRNLKFGFLWDIIRGLGGEMMATGHYVQLENHQNWIREQEDQNEPIPDWLRNQPSNQLFLKRSDSPKDQSYFLFDIRKEMLSRLRFPIGSLIKNDVRRIAAEAGLQGAGFSMAAKKESQEVCFVPDTDCAAFLRRFAPEQDTSGAFISTEGKIIGQHSGYEKYTVGQRKGLGMGFGERIFVQKIDPINKTVMLGPREALACREIRAKNCHWHLDIPKDQEFRCEIRIRYRNPAVMATVRVDGEGNLIAEPDEPRYGVAAGQALVCYLGRRLLGGGWIDS